MDIREKLDQGVLIVSLHGRLDELAAPSSESTLIAIAQDGPEQIILDLTEVEYISSSGLRVLLTLYKAIERGGGTLRLCGLTPFVAEVFEISNFAAMFEIFPDQEAALKACVS